MGFDIKHSALYFGQAEIDNARSEREKNENLQSAWQWLLAQPGDVVKEVKAKDKKSEPEQIVKPELSQAGELIESAFRYCFVEDKSAGQDAIDKLSSGFGLSDKANLLETVIDTVTVAQAFEMLRDIMPEGTSWLEDFSNFTDSLLENYEDAEFLEQLWLITLKMVSAVVLEDEERFKEAVADVKQVINTQLHPEGYFKPLSIKPETKEVAYKEMVLACGALTLASEAATQAGENLWKYENRGSGLNTAVTYLVYYYFYPDKWRWGDEDLSVEHTEAIFADSGAWIEISTGRVNPRGVELLLEEQRPFFSPHMGGLTTLSHIKMGKRWRFGLFG